MEGIGLEEVCWGNQEAVEPRCNHRDKLQVSARNKAGGASPTHNPANLDDSADFLHWSGIVQILWHRLSRIFFCLDRFLALSFAIYPMIYEDISRHSFSKDGP
jgi:hypothetical protein